MGVSFRPILISSTSICFALISTAAYAAPTDYDGKWLVFLHCSASIYQEAEFRINFNMAIANGRFSHNINGQPVTRQGKLFIRNSIWKGRVQDKVVTVEAEYYNDTAKVRERFAFSGKPTAPYQMKLSGNYWIWRGGYTGGSDSTRTCTLTLNLIKGAPLSLAVQ